MKRYYMNELLDVDSEIIDEEDELKSPTESAEPKASKLKPRKGLKPILQKLGSRKPLKVEWIGTSFGVTPQLFGFWTKNGYQPIYIRQTANSLTGEYTSILVHGLPSEEIELRTVSYTHLTLPTTPYV